MPRTEMAEQLGVSRKTLYKHLGRVEEEERLRRPAKADAAGASPKNGGKPHKKEMHPHDGRRQNRGTPPPGPHSTGFAPGNDAATVTGEYRNPMLHGVSPERILLVRDAAELSPVEMLRRSIARYTLTIADMTQEIEAIKESDKQFWVIGTTYKRQEGDGELMGTGRVAQRQRMPRMEALRIMMDALTKVQARHDAAASKLAAIEKGLNPEGGNGPTTNYLVLSPAQARELALQQGLMPVDERRIGGGSA